jgi:hypothetical protein
MQGKLVDMTPTNITRNTLTAGITTCSPAVITKARKLIAAGVIALPAGSYIVPSSDGTRTYTVTEAGCPCKGAEYGRFCCHQAARAIAIGRPATLSEIRIGWGEDTNCTVCLCELQAGAPAWQDLDGTLCCFCAEAEGVR